MTGATGATGGRIGTDGLEQVGPQRRAGFRRLGAQERVWFSAASRNTASGPAHEVIDWEHPKSTARCDSRGRKFEYSSTALAKQR